MDTGTIDLNCAECGVESVIKVDDVPMCGHCFRLGMTAAQSRQLHRLRAPRPASTEEEALEAAVRAALEEFDDLKRKMDELLGTLEA